MAEVTNFPAEPPEDEFYHNSISLVLDFDSITPRNNSPNRSFLDDYTASFRFGFDLNETLGCEYEEEPDCFFYGGGEDDDDEQMNFASDLFESRETHVIEETNLGFDAGMVEEEEDPPFELGFGPGLRVASMDSESDSDEFGVNTGFVEDNDVDDFDSFVVGNRDSFRVSESVREEFEWEEVNERIHFEERENLEFVTDRIEGISVSSDTSSSEVRDSRSDEEWEEEERNIEWEVLQAVGNLETSLGFENSEENDNNGGEAPTLSLPEDYILQMEYDTLFEQLLESESALKGSPPAAKSVVENLPLVVLSKKEVGEDNSAVVCAVCKDDVAEGEKVNKLPCSHLYHGDCIRPWLKIRNSCPVCRYELPTDDANYEKRKSEPGGSGIDAVLVDDDLDLRSNFELFL